MPLLLLMIPDVLIGVLTVDALVEDVLADLFPEGFLPDVTGLDSLMSSAGLFVKQRVVDEIMDEPHSVNHSDLVGSAIQKMRVNELRGLPYCRYRWKSERLFGSV